MALLMSVSALANHNDAVPVGVRVSVTGINQMTGQVDFDVYLSSDSSGKDTSSFVPWIGNRFYYDGTLRSLSSPAPAAVRGIDYGDGQFVAATSLSITGTSGSSSSVKAAGAEAKGGGNGLTFSRGSFSHTYASPGNYTIRATALGVYLGSLSSPNYTLQTGNWVTTTAFVSTSGRSYTGASVIMGVSNTASAAVSGAGGGGAAAIPIPTLGDPSQWLLGLLLMLAGTFALTRR
jgi:hypothetical protein